MLINSGIAGSYWDWCNATYDNLWSADNTVESYNDNPVVKTIYDPCPVGFHMPASNAFTGFTKDGQNGGPLNVSGARDWGWNFNNKITSPNATVYFPASGFRYYYDGSLRSVGGLGYCWSAIPGGPGYGHFLFFNQMRVDPYNDMMRSYGFPVRPVADN